MDGPPTPTPTPTPQLTRDTHRHIEKCNDKRIKIKLILYLMFS